MNYVHLISGVSRSSPPSTYLNIITVIQIYSLHYYYIILIPTPIPSQFQPQLQSQPQPQSQSQPQLQLQHDCKYNYNYNSTTLHCTPLHHTTLPLHDHYRTTTGPIHFNYNYKDNDNNNNNNNNNYNYNYTTVHPAVVGEVTTATTPKSTTPTTFWSISGFALPSMHHNNSPLL